MKPVVRDLNEIPESYRGEYVERELDLNGSKSKVFVLDVTPDSGFALENVDGLKKTLKNLRADLENNTKQLKNYEGIDPEVARQALEKIKVFEGQDPEKKISEVVSLKAKELAAQHEKAMGVVKDQNTRLQSQIEELLITNNATAILVEEGGSPELLMPHIKGRARIRATENGRFATEVLDEEGNPDINSKGDPKTLRELIVEMKNSEKFSRAFAPTGATGSGGKGSAGPATRGNQAAPRGGVKRAQVSANGVIKGASLEEIVSGDAVVSN